MDRKPFDDLMLELRACRLCEAHLPLGPRPVMRGWPTSRLLIISQAPGTRVHETGISFNDRSGDRLRLWLGIDRTAFYDESKVAILPMGLCYPGVDRQGGDRPPRPECAPLWHPRVLSVMPEIKLTLLVGSYALKRYLPAMAKRSMTEIIQDWRQFRPAYFVLPHPSWRNTGWLKRNPWFDEEILPALRLAVSETLSG
jgi:uracil-DNA glycosylase